VRWAHAVGHALGRGAAVTAVLLVPAGCGDATSPAEAVPEIGTALERVDRALAAGNLLRAQRRLDRLVRITVGARRTGDLESSDSDAILAAAASLAAELPRSGLPPQLPEPETRDSGGDAEGDGEGDGKGDGEAPAEEPAPQGGGGLDEEEAKKRAEELEKKREELQKQREELQKELEKQQEEQAKKEGEESGQSEGDEGGGNGDSSENGPDDGHGN
jgi:hypothetical protein